MNKIETKSRRESGGCMAQGCGSSADSKARLKRWLVKQFGLPAGMWGSIAGHIMAKRRSNIERNLWTIDFLDLRPTDRVLEVGFGPGIAIAAASRHIETGLVVGLDHSEVMLRQAAKRNAAAVRQGRVQLLLGSVTELPEFDGSFDKIYAVNSVAFWPRPVERLAELRGLMAPGGRIAITEQPRLQQEGDGAARSAGKRISAQLEQAGFTRVRADFRPMKSTSVVCVRGEAGG